jgi:hypothetical protein
MSGTVLYRRALARFAVSLILTTADGFDLSDSSLQHVRKQCDGRVGPAIDRSMGLDVGQHLAAHV